MIMLPSILVFMVIFLSVLYAGYQTGVKTQLKNRSDRVRNVLQDNYVDPSVIKQVTEVLEQF